MGPISLQSKWTAGEWDHLLRNLLPQITTYFRELDPRFRSSIHIRYKDFLSTIRCYMISLCHKPSYYCHESQINLTIEKQSQQGELIFHGYRFPNIMDIFFFLILSFRFFELYISKAHLGILESAL